MLSFSEMRGGSHLPDCQKSNAIPASPSTLLQSDLPSTTHPQTRPLANREGKQRTEACGEVLSGGSGKQKQESRHQILNGCCVTSSLRHLEYLGHSPQFSRAQAWCYCSEKGTKPHVHYAEGISEFSGRVEVTQLGHQPSPHPTYPFPAAQAGLASSPAEKSSTKHSFPTGSTT